MKRDSLHLWSVDLLIVGEEEPVCDPHIKELRVPPMLFDQFQASLVAVSPTEEHPGIPLPPWDATSLLGSQNREGDPGDYVEK